MKKVLKKQRGFTLLELVVVIAILGLIAAMATEFVAFESNQTRYDLTKERRATIRTALSNYYDDCSDFPDHLDWLVSKTQLDSNRCGAGNDDWEGPYILDVDFESGVAVYRDGWGNASGAVATDHDFGWVYENNTASVALSTLGLDRQAGQVSAPNTQEYVFEADEGENFALLTAPSSTNYFLISTASGASLNILSCREGAASTSAPSVSLSNCL